MNTIYGLGGMVGVITEQGKSAELATVRPSIPHDCGYSSKSWAQMYLYGIQLTGGAPVAIATDFNGFAGQPAPRFGAEACNGDKLASQTGGVHYPFSIVGGNGAKLDRSVIGHKNFDYNYDGLAHVGMLPDFIQDLRSIGVTDNDLKPLFRSAEAYIRMWEKIHSLSVYPPQTTITVVAPNAAGWHKSNVTLNLIAALNQDGWNIQSLAYGSTGSQAQPETVIPHTGTGPASAGFPVTTEGTTTVSFSATDSAGNKSQPITRQVKLDKTPPVIVVNGNAGTYTVDQTIDITCTILDALSGVASSSCPPIKVPAYTLDPGAQSRSVSATDIAGNTATATVTFTVAVNASGMTNLIKTFIGQSSPQLVDSYKALLEQISRANTAAAKAGAVTAFVNAVNAQAGNAFTQPQAATLLRLAGGL
jgi:hypothetical protein